MLKIKADDQSTEKHYMYIIYFKNKLKIMRMI